MEGWSQCSYGEGGQRRTEQSGAKGGRIGQGPATLSARERRGVGSLTLSST